MIKLKWKRDCAGHYDATLKLEENEAVLTVYIDKVKESNWQVSCSVESETISLEFIDREKYNTLKDAKHMFLWSIGSQLGDIATEIQWEL